MAQSKVGLSKVCCLCRSPNVEAAEESLFKLEINDLTENELLLRHS